MKTIKIFCMPSHGTVERISGVDYARIIQPGKFLDGYKYGDYEFKVHVYDPRAEDKTPDKLDWLQVAMEYDIIYLNYTASSWQFAAMGAFARKYNRKIVLDLDDSLWDIKKDNPAYIAYHKGSQAIHDFNAICNEVDYVTVTNSYLKNVVANNTLKRHEKIIVFPNYVDLSLYNHRSPVKDDHQIVLTHYGSTSHFIDLDNQEFARGVDRIMKEYPHVILRTVGAMLSKYKWRWGQRYENAYGHQDVITWIKDYFPKFMDQTDIIVVPLMNDRYNRCKSSIKFIESGSAKKVGVWQKIRQYEEIIDNENGFLAETEEDWYESIKKLIDNKELRQKMGENAFATVEKDWKIENNIEKYAKFFSEIV